MDPSYLSNSTALAAQIESLQAQLTQLIASQSAFTAAAAAPHASSSSLPPFAAHAPTYNLNSRLTGLGGQSNGHVPLRTPHSLPPPLGHLGPQGDPFPHLSDHMARPSTPVGPPIDPSLNLTPPTPQPQSQMSYAPDFSSRATQSHSHGTPTPASLPPRHMSSRPMPSAYPRQDAMDLQNGGLDVSSALLHTVPRRPRACQHLPQTFKDNRAVAMAQGRKRNAANRAVQPLLRPPPGPIPKPKGQHSRDYHTAVVLGLSQPQWRAAMTFAHEACIAARLNLTVGIDGQNVRNLATAYKMINETFSKTPIPRCVNDWASFNIIKTFLRNRIARAARLKHTAQLEEETEGQEMDEYEEQQQEQEGEEEEEGY